MPVMDGREFLSRLRHLPGATPTVVVITGQDHRFVPGAAAVLRKPVSFAQLLGLVRGLMLLSENYDGRWRGVTLPRLNKPAALEKLFPILNSKVRDPENRNAKWKLGPLIVCLNDRRRWSRERIADWLDRHRAP